MKWDDRLITWLLRSPLHKLLSGGTMLIAVTGLRSGNSYTFPVDYVRDGEGFLIMSYRNRRWWRNLGGGAQVSVRVKGQDLTAVAEAITDRQAVETELANYLRGKPLVARYAGVRFDAEGRPDAGALARAARDKVMVRVRPL